jgi:8-oxo-dGTP pyrophosphatase MutT (NUDIX family)
MIMRTIHRDIVGAFIFSTDDKVLLGHNRKGGVYQDQLVVPGGGIEENETKIEALKRETLEETGIDISDAMINQVEGSSIGESEKTLQTGERVFVKMNFYDFKIRLPVDSESVTLHFDDDYAGAQWYSAKDLKNAPIGPTTKATLQKIQFI